MYKRGQYVVCVDNWNGTIALIQVGKVYKITHIWTTLSMIGLKEFPEKNRRFNMKLFRIATPLEKAGDKVIHIEYSQSGVITTEADWLKSNLVYIKYNSIEDVYFIKWDNGGYTTAFGKTHAENALRILTPLEEAML